jgi:ribosomal protein L31
VWSNVTPAQYAELVSRAQAAHIPITGDSGQASKMGVDVTWSYANSTLTIQVESAPFFIGQQKVKDDIAAIVDSVLAANLPD